MKKQISKRHYYMLMFIMDKGKNPKIYTRSEFQRYNISKMLSILN